MVGVDIYADMDNDIVPDKKSDYSWNNRARKSNLDKSRYDSKELSDFLPNKHDYSESYSTNISGNTVRSKSKPNVINHDLFDDVFQPTKPPVKINKNMSGYYWSKCF